MPETLSRVRSWRGWTRGEGLIVVAGTLLIADLVLLPWHHYALNLNTGDLPLELPTFALDRTGVQSPDSQLGIGALVLTGLMVVQLLAAKATSAVPKLAFLHLIVGPAAFGLLAAKLLSDDQFLGAGAWLGQLLGAAVALGGYFFSQEAAGMAEDARGSAPAGSGSVSPT